MHGIMQLADALDCMHRYSLLHRDIKAENIVFADTAAQAAAKRVPPIVKFIDLGMATLYDKAKPQTGARPMPLHATLAALCCGRVAHATCTGMQLLPRSLLVA